MNCWRSLWLSAVLLSFAALAAAQTSPPVAPATCPVTKAPEAPFVPAPPDPAFAPNGNFWHGTEHFWAMVYRDGAWGRLPRNHAGYAQKIFWWRPGFDGYLEPSPAITVTAKRLDAPDFVVLTRKGTNAYHRGFGGWAMLTGVVIPTAGCWEITGHYQGYEVSFVVSVGP